jgi:hypothetical protein
LFDDLVDRIAKRTTNLICSPTSQNGLTRLLALMLMIACIFGCKSAVWKARVLADNQDHPSKIISDGSSVFYVTGGTQASQNEGTNNVNRISLKDGSVSVLVKGGEHLPSQTLAVDERFVYWSEPGRIFRVPKAGGESEMIVSDAPGKPDEMVLDDENIYWTEPVPKTIGYAPLDGGTTVTQLRVERRCGRELLARPAVLVPGAALRPIGGGKRGRGEDQQAKDAEQSQC